MKERPILFNGEMVRAILDGRKTQFRMPVKPQPPASIDGLHGGKLASRAPYKLRDDNDSPWGYGFQDDCGQFWESPFGTVGDRLWLKEAFEICRETCSYEYEEYDLFPWESDLYGDPKDSLKPKCPRGGHRSIVLYRADEEEASETWHSPVHMPRWASRIELEITRVWVERVQDITDFNAFQEGAKSEAGRITGPCCMSFKQEFYNLWQSIYGNRPKLPDNKDGKRYQRVKRWLDKNPQTDWDANPFVWAYEFRRVKP